MSAVIIKSDDGEDQHLHTTNDHYIKLRNNLRPCPQYFNLIIFFVKCLKMSLTCYKIYTKKVY